MRRRTKALATILTAALLVVAFVVAAIWKFIEADKCLDAGGMVVASFTREQLCVMRDDKHSSSRP